MTPAHIVGGSNTLQFVMGARLSVTERRMRLM
jgi:hypothetical protein